MGHPCSCRLYLVGSKNIMLHNYMAINMISYWARCARQLIENAIEILEFGEGVPECIVQSSLLSLQHLHLCICTNDIPPVTCPLPQNHMMLCALKPFHPQTNHCMPPISLEFSSYSKGQVQRATTTMQH